MSVTSKSKRLLRVWLPIECLDANENNPNKMSSREFDLLVENMDTAGITDPVLCWPKDHLSSLQELVKSYEKSEGKKPDPEAPDELFCEMIVELGIRVQIIGGHHRVEAMKYHDEKYVFCTVIMDPKFTEQDADNQLMRHNMIRGRLDPEKFVKLVEKQLKQGVSLEDMPEMFGIADEAAFKKMVETMTQQLPPEMKQKFKEAASEAKSIDELATILNHLFATYGDTLKFSYMVFDHGGKKSIWLRTSKKTYDQLLKVGSMCIDASVTLDEFMGRLLHIIATGQQPEMIEALFNACKKVTIPGGFTGAPTQEAIDAVLEAAEK